MRSFVVATLAILACTATASPRERQRAPAPDDDPTEDSSEPGDEGDDAGAGIDVAPERLPREHGLIDELHRELSVMRSSVYSHTTHVSEADGRFDVDCSGLVDYALARAAPDALAALRKATVKRPLAKHFVEFLRSPARNDRDPRWRSISQVTALVPGDIIAWLRPADVATHNTGHVMVVRGKIERDPAHADTLIVPVIDSTAVPHGRSDSRKAAHATGLGTGEVLLVVDASGAPIAYRWSRGTRAHPHATTIALGRVTPQRPTLR